MTPFFARLGAVSIALTINAGLSAAATFSGFSSTLVNNPSPGAVSINATLPDSDTLNISASWTQPGLNGYVSFTAADNFDIFLTDYIDLEDVPQVSAFSLETVSGAGDFSQFFEGETRSFLEGDADSCSSLLPNGCFIVTNTTATSGPFVGDGGTINLGLVEIAYQPSESTSIVSGLAPGDYRFWFAESGSPAVGNVSFDLRTTPVPLPASVLILLGGVGALGAMGARKG